MEQTIIVSAFFAGLAGQEKILYFERLNAYLQQYQVQLFLVNLNGTKLRTKCNSIGIHVDCTKMGKSTQGLEKYRKLSHELTLAMAMEASLKNDDFFSQSSAILDYTEFMIRLLLEKKPCLCILWHQHSGQHRALAAICQDLDVPYVFAHLGMLPGTIVFEHGGQNAESWVTQNNEDFLKLQIDDRDLVVAQQYLEYVRKIKKDRKPQTTKLTIRDIVDKNRKTIFYAGQNDYQSGLWPSWLPKSRIHSPLFFHTFDGLQYIARISKVNDWQILFKPHPNIQNRQTSSTRLNHEHIDFVKGANIFECMEKSDLTVTILSQVSYQALIHGNPVVLLGCNQLSGKGCAYEVTSHDNIENTIKLALKEGFSKDQKRNWVRHVAQACKYYLFSFEKEILNIIGRDVDEAANYLIMKSNFPKVLYGINNNTNGYGTAISKAMQNERSTHTNKKQNLHNNSSRTYSVLSFSSVYLKSIFRRIRNLFS
jgi:hypothetical protein